MGAALRPGHSAAPGAVLVLGGTQFVGRAIVLALRAAGHAVTVLNRGQSADDLPADVQRLRGDRDTGAAGLAALAGRRWQACVDVSGYTAAQVGASVQALRGQVGRYVFISAVSVYGSPTHGPVAELHPCLPPANATVTEVDGQTYGPLKVACEQIVQQVFGASATLLRPQVLVGPGDTWNRYSHWVRRAAQPGPMLAPGQGDDLLQVLDVRDLAQFVVTVLANDLAGVYNLAGPRLSWRAFITLLGVRQPVWVPAALLQAAALDFTQLPLWRPAGSPRAGLMDVDARRALAAGLRLREPVSTLADVRAACQGQSWTPALAPDLEAALIQRALSLPSPAVPDGV